MSFFTTIALLSYITVVRSLCTSITLSGGDSSLGYAGGISGFSAVDGCYTRTILTHFTKYGNEKSQSVSYIKYNTPNSDGLYPAGPIFFYIDASEVQTWSRDAWTLNQVSEFTSGEVEESSDIEDAAETHGIMYSYGTQEDPSEADSWLSWTGNTVYGFSITCGCDDDSDDGGNFVDSDDGGNFVDSDDGGNTSNGHSVYRNKINMVFIFLAWSLKMMI